MFACYSKYQPRNAHKMLIFCDFSACLYIYMHLYNFNPFQLLEDVYGWFNSQDPKVWDPRSKHLPA